MFCNWVFSVFFRAKWQWVLRTRQSDVRERASLSQADLSTFRFDVVYKFIAFTICDKLCVDISWPFHSHSSVCHTFLNLIVLIIWCQTISITSGWYLPLFSFNTCSLGNNILILWRENTYWSLTWGVQEQNMGNFILWTFLTLFCH